MDNSVRCLVCFKCEEYITIHPDRKQNLEMENKFKAFHVRHMIQVVTYDEIPTWFTRFIYQEHIEEIELDMEVLV